MRRQIYTLILILGVMLLFPLSGTAATKGIRIVPRSAWVKNDSLHLSILMDLEDVQVNTYTAVTFTPVLTNKQSTLGTSGRHTDRRKPPPVRQTRTGLADKQKPTGRSFPDNLKTGTLPVVKK